MSWVRIHRNPAPIDGWVDGLTTSPPATPGLREETPLNIEDAAERAERDQSPDFDAIPAGVVGDPGVVPCSSADTRGTQPPAARGAFRWAGSELGVQAEVTVWSALDLETLAMEVGSCHAVSVARSDSSIGVGFPDGRCFTVIPGLVGSLAPLVHALRAPRLIVHRVTDLAQSLGLALIDGSGVFDTCLVARVLDGGEHFDTPAYFDFGALVSRLNLACANETRKVGVGSFEDVRLLFDVERELDLRVRKAHLVESADLELRVLPEVVAMREAGLRFEWSRWCQLVYERQSEADDLEQKLRDWLGITNLRSQAELLAGFRYCGIAITQTRNESLMPWASHPGVKAFMRFRRLDGFLNSIAAPLTAALRTSPDRRVHADYDQLGAKTGRMSCTGANLLGLPRDPAVRRCIIPTDGFVFVDADYVAAELRVLAEEAHDGTLREAFRTGQDPHRITAAAITGKPPCSVTDDDRRRSKPINFGAAYAMGVATMAEYAEKAYGISMTLEQAAAWIDVFRKTYPGVWAWQQRTKQAMPSETRTHIGRVRRYSSQDGYPARLASPVQGTVADATKLAMVLAGPRLRAIGGRIVLTVHDHLLAEVPGRAAEEGKLIVESAMVEAFETLVAIPAKVECNILSTWGG